MAFPEKAESNTAPIKSSQAAPRFFRAFVAYSLVVAALFYLAEPSLPSQAMYANHMIIQLIVMAATLIIHFGLRSAAAKSGPAFIRFFMAASGIKMFTFLIIMMGYGLMNRTAAFGFIIHFFAYYLLYTIFEVAVSYRTFSRA